ncbi:MAG: hypothetical protein K2L88_00920, partial [Clostridiales bacterium]|nr:hypothetical protein [Clostridiales bacterium]
KQYILKIKPSVEGFILGFEQIRYIDRDFRTFAHGVLFFDKTKWRSLSKNGINIPKKLNKMVKKG